MWESEREVSEMLNLVFTFGHCGIVVSLDTHLPSTHQLLYKVVLILVSVINYSVRVSFGHHEYF